MYKVFFKAQCYAKPTAITVLINGTQVFSGQVGNNYPLTEHFDSEALESALGLGETASVSISCTSGVANLGPWHTVLNPWWAVDLRQSDSILINGQPPEIPATPVGFEPGGTLDSPDWTGWFFELSAGETVSFNIKIPDTPWKPKALMGTA